MSTHKESTTKKLRCVCESTYQNLLYGKGIRVHNRVNKAAQPTWKCTVCSNPKVAA